MPKRVTWSFITFLFVINNVSGEYILLTGFSMPYSATNVVNIVSQLVNIAEETNIFSQFDFDIETQSISSAQHDKVKQSGQLNLNDKIRSLPQEKKKIVSTSGKYVLIKTGPTRVLEKLSPDSPILGMANRGANYPLLQAGDSWCTILYEDKEGWIERQYVKIVNASSKSIFFKDFFIVAAAICSIALIIAIIYFINRRTNKIKTEWFSTGNITKKVIIISRTETQVQRLLTNNMTSLAKCFTEIGFEVKRAYDSDTAMKLIFHYLPDAIVVDWQIGYNTQHVIEQILASKSSTSNIFVLFYNVSDPLKIQKSRIITNTYYLGISFTDRDLFKIITPLIITGEKTHTIRKSVEATALQGNIDIRSLSEVFQFIEIGKKTGCLLIEDQKPSGIVYFNNGIIIHAASRHFIGKKAVFELLNLQYGQFHFVLGKEPKSPNCSIQTLGVLMEWTKEADETSRNRLRQA